MRDEAAPASPLTTGGVWPVAALRWRADESVRRGDRTQRQEPSGWLGLNLPLWLAARMSHMTSQYVQKVMNDGGTSQNMFRLIDQKYIKNNNKIKSLPFCFFMFLVYNMLGNLLQWTPFGTQFHHVFDMYIHTWTVYAFFFVFLRPHPLSEQKLSVTAY